MESLMPPELRNMVAFPFVKDFLLPLGFAFPLFAMLTMTGFGNAVNFTDGLDGLAIVPVVIAALVFALIAYLVGNRVFADYLQLHLVPGTGELAVFCAALIGAGLGFLWFNATPADVFMGDTGSLSLGGALGAVAVAVKHELVLCIVGGLFVVETLSVVIQVFWYKRTKRRVFLMAPLHHHFEKKGWQEPKIVIRFWIVSILLGLAGLATLSCAEMTDCTFPTDLFAGSRFAVAGLGRNGSAVVKALLAMGAEVQAWDDKNPPEADPAQPRFTAAPIETLAGLDALILSPGIPHVLPAPHPVAVRARDADVPILSDAEILFQAVRRAGSKARFAAITGTNGKSTTTALLATCSKKPGDRLLRAAISERPRSPCRFCPMTACM